MMCLDPAFEETELTATQSAVPHHRTYILFTVLFVPLHICQLVHYTEQFRKEGNIPRGLIFPRQRRLTSFGHEAQCCFPDRV